MQTVTTPSSRSSTLIAGPRASSSSWRAPAEVLREAVDAHLHADDHGRTQIEAALREAEAGDFADEEAVAAAFAPR